MALTGAPDNSVPSTYAIFRYPLDFPDDYVVRRFDLPTGGKSIPGPILAVVKTYEAALAVIPPGLVKLERSEEDHPSVVETWASQELYDLLQRYFQANSTGEHPE